MPQIPVYESQVSTGGVPQTPRATADDFGAQTNEAIVGLTQAGLDLAGTVITARRAAEANRGQADATREFDAARKISLEDEDPATLPDRLKQHLDEAEARYRAMSDDAYRDAALGVFKSLGPTFLANERINAAKREAVQHRTELDSASDSYAEQAAAAPNDLQRQGYVNLAKTAVVRANAAGYITRDDALARLRDLPGRIEEKRAEALIERDPKAAVAALEDKKQFANLAPASRDLLQEKAKLADQHAHFATVNAIQQGIADGTKTDYDIDTLLKDGVIGQATSVWLKKLSEDAAKERTQKIEGRNRVQSVLDEGGKLDAKKAKDRAAIDAYYDAVVAPTNPDQPTLVSYVRQTGVVPTKVAQSIKGGLASDEPQQVVNAASLMRELGKHDDALVKGFGAKRKKFADTVMDGIDGGLSAKRAIDLADKSHGQPNASDGTESAGAESGRASDAGTDEAADTPRGESQSDKDQDVSAAAESSRKAEAGAADETGGKNASSDAEGATGTTTETVGSEVRPVGGTEDGAGEPDRPKMVERFARRFGSAIDRAFEGQVGLDPQDIRVLRERGLFRTGQEGRFDPMATIRAFNEILIGGGIAGVDLAGRLGEAFFNVLAAAVAQTAQELGDSQGMSRRLERDVNLLLVFAAMLGMTRGPSGLRRSTGVPGERPGVQRGLSTDAHKLAPEARLSASPDSASRPVGRSGNPIEIKPGTNRSDKIYGDDGRVYSGHSLDRMQGRGIPPSAIEDTIENGQKFPGKMPGTTAHYNPDNDITVITNTTTGNVITVRHGRP